MRIKKNYCVRTWKPKWSKWTTIISILQIILIFTFCRLTTSSHEECPQRDVQGVRHSAANAELGLVLYYTSWNKASLTAHKVYAELAQYYYDDAYFGAIDCWHLRCNCSRTHVPIGDGLGIPHTWPTLIVNYGRGAVQMQYHGEWDFASLMNFMENLLTPIDRINNRGELRSLIAKSDGVVLGLFPDMQNLKPDHRRQYNRFVMAAVKWLETDPERSFRFTAALGTSAMKAILNTTTISGSQQVPQILLIGRTTIATFNATSVSASGTTSERAQNRWHVPHIVHWVQDELRRSYRYVYSETTPTSLIMRLRHGHTLLVLATDAELHQLIDGVLNFPSATSTYQSCDKYWQHATDTAEYLLYRQLKHHHINTKKDDKQCANSNEFTLRTLSDYYRINAYLNQRFQQFIHHPPSEDTADTYDDGANIGDDDMQSTMHLRELYQYRQCLKHPTYGSQELRVATAKYLKKSIDNLFANTTTAHALHNRTLSVVILDANKFRDYNFLNRDSMHLHTAASASGAAAAYIIDPQGESIFPMHEPMGYDAILRFVHLYYVGSPLTVHHSSSSIHRQEHQHTVAATAATTTTTNSQHIHIHEYNRDMFLNAVYHHQQQRESNGTTKTIVALLYSPKCAFSSMLSHIILQLGIFLNSNDIQFIRVNTLTNDLPWEYAMPITPTLIVFPRDNYAESRVFPTHLRANVQNVLGFILAQIQPIDQIKLVLDSCKRAGVSVPQQQRCLKFAKHLITQHISKSLHYWQIFESERHFILNRLKEFKDLSSLNGY